MSSPLSTLGERNRDPILPKRPKASQALELQVDSRSLWKEVRKSGGRGTRLFIQLSAYRTRRAVKVKVKVKSGADGAMWHLTETVGCAVKVQVKLGTSWS